MAEAVGFAASILGIIQITTKVASLSYSYIGGVKRAPSEARKLSDELKSLTTVLTTLNICAKDHGPALQQLQGPLQTCISDLHRIQAKLESGAKTKGSSWWDMGLTRLQWPFEEQETLNFVSQLERFKSLVLVTMSIDQVTRSRMIQTGVQEMNAVKSKDEELRIEKKRMDVLNWLYPDDFDRRHIEISGRRQKNTGQWILREPEVQEWCGGNPRNRLLWGYGIPGAGKTFLSSLLIDHLQERTTKANYGLAYIYFNYKEQDQQDPRSFLASLVKQLACQLERLPKVIEELHKRLEKRHGRPTIDDLSTILFELKKSFTLTFIVCDALDECDPEKQRKTLLPLFHKMAKNGINILLTSREYPEDIQVSFRGSASTKIRLWAKDEDITFYIKQKIADNPRAKRLVEQGSCEGKIISQLQKCANGMFLLVHFHIRYLCQQTTVKQILEELERLENSSREDYPMDPTYNRALDALRAQPKGCTELAFKVLTWLVRARRVLTVHELQLAVSVPIGGDCKTFDNSDLPDRSTLLDVCASLVMVDEKEDTIRLVHYTVQEYLLRNAIIPNDTDSNVMITTACITFLSLDIFLQGACNSDKSLQDRWELYPFLDYAAKQLSPHLERCDEVLSTRPILVFLNRNGNISSYVQALHVKRWPEKQGGYDLYPKGQRALHIAASLGHRSVTQILLENGDDVMVADNVGRTPLHWAASGGYMPVVKLLIEGGADASAVDNAGITALQRAAWKGHETVVMLLEIAGKPMPELITRLHVAAASGRLEMVKLLLEAGERIDISSEDTDGWNALRIAASSGHEPVVRLLLEKGANISSEDTDGWNALRIAALNGHEPVVRLLLEKGADISAADIRRQDSLYLAACNGHEPVVRLLLEKGANISSADIHGRCSLHIAARNGHESVVQLLLEGGADISSADIHGRCSLHIAARNGREPVVRLLLEKGADISSVSRGGWTALHFAAQDGHEPVARLLLEKGADIFCTVGDRLDDRWDAIRFAEDGGYKQIAELLREKAATIIAERFEDIS